MVTAGLGTMDRPGAEQVEVREAALREAWSAWPGVASGRHIPPPIKADVRSLSFWYGKVQAVKNVSIPIADRRVTALIGPSGCGKTTLLRCFNRMHDLYRNTRYEGQIVLHPSSTDIIDRRVNPIEMRMRIGMVFQKPNPFPKSIFENVAFGLRMKGFRGRSEIADRVEAAIRAAALWDEVSDRLRKPAYDLSGGQQQRLCIARALATEPEMVLFDEPTSALDPVATARIEELVQSLKERVTVLIVTHNMQQAGRVSDFTAFMYLGEMVEFDRTEKVFQNPGKQLTEQYISGRFG
ncbi:MAG TPA: phosphate ABC transporter ATP-binding protein PstB [Phycisphaerales bacterium]|nr:phosphate ABC transporter ATP-binding protein PstB [Phycisphaerales bacterium]